MKKSIDVYEYMNEIVAGIKNGSLVTVKDGDKVNCMTISWGQIGIEWHKLIFTVFVRNDRFTHEMLEKTNEFSINMSLTNNEDPVQQRILEVCGTESGRDVDKVEKLDISLVKGKNIETPGLKELPLTLECKIIYRQFQDKEMMIEEIKDRFYPKYKLEEYKKYHTMFYGEVVSAYIIK